MEYKTLLAARIQLWHPHLTASRLEEIVGKTPAHFHSVGDIRPHTPSSSYQESYADFPVMSATYQSFSDAAKECVLLLRRIETSAPTFRSSGGRSAIVIELLAADFVQLDLEPAELFSLQELKTHLVIENHS